VRNFSNNLRFCLLFCYSTHWKPNKPEC